MSVPSMALLPTFSLITYETRRALEQHLPEAANQLPREQIERVKAIRNAAKWFDASKDGAQEALRRFQDMTDSHAAEFLGNTPYLWARPLESDLGIYSLGGVDILNTHILGVLLGPEALTGIGPSLKDMSATMSNQAARLSVDIGDDGSFIDTLGLISDRDVRSWEYYASAKQGDLATAGYLHAVWSTLAFLRLVRPTVADDEGSAFKVQYIGLYHAAKTLARLDKTLIEQPHGLTDGDSARRLRNALVHYIPHDDTPESALVPNRPRQALVEYAFAREFKTVAWDVSQAIESLHVRMGTALGH